jgi:simple sugar transport system ATP-binding protein
VLGLIGDNRAGKSTLLKTITGFHRPDDGRILLEGEEDTEVARLSGGQRQAIAVARAVYSDAKMLLLDEPLAAMGAKEGALILDLIQRLKEERGIPMILIVHNYAQVFDVCDRVNLLRNGRIEYDRPVAETSVEELTEIVVSEYRKARETGNGG